MNKNPPYQAVHPPFAMELATKFKWSRNAILIELGDSIISITGEQRLSSK